MIEYCRSRLEALPAHHAPAGRGLRARTPDTRRPKPTAPPPATGAPEPAASLTLTLSSERWIEISGTSAVGTQTVAVRFANPRVHEDCAGQHGDLVRVAAHTDLKAQAAWTDWTRRGGLQTPAPAEFLGGVNEMPTGSTGHLTVTLEPGRYAWIAEVPNPQPKGMPRVFTGPGGGARAVRACLLASPAAGAVTSRSSMSTRSSCALDRASPWWRWCAHFHPRQPSVPDDR